MPQGLQVFNASGQIILDTNNRVSRYLGTVTSGTSSGAISVSAFSTGTPWFFIRSGVDSTKYVPEVTVSGTTLSWYFNPSSAPTAGHRLSIQILYGVY